MLHHAARRQRRRPPRTNTTARDDDGALRPNTPARDDAGAPPNDRPAVNQRLLLAASTTAQNRARPIGDLWAGVEGAQGARPARDRLESKSDMKRHPRYLASLGSLEDRAGQPFAARSTVAACG